ncbi:MAG: DUF3883 domain-containing protein [Caldilineaceae bacterium]|nr:DUF3883 domain-containing protein [Caldilineaceae bacterium]
MKPENELAIIVAFYLSKYGESGLANLGYRTYRQAFDSVGSLLGVKPNSVKNWRDEFDPFYDNNRKGWYRRGIRPTRAKVMEAFDALSENAITVIVRDIVDPGKATTIASTLQATLAEIERADTAQEEAIQREIRYTPRGPTGRMAEEVFIAKFRAGLTPFAGEFQDRRDEGVGFDFEVISEQGSSLIEVKGLAKERGGISFTDKEWSVANGSQNSYFLGLVTDTLTSPKIGFLQNPAKNFTPAYYAYTTVTVNWNVSASQIDQIVVS